MQKQQVIYEDLGVLEYQQAWDYQEELLHRNVQVKSAVRSLELAKTLRKARYFHQILQAPLIIYCLLNILPFIHWVKVVISKIF